MTLLLDNEALAPLISAAEFVAAQDDAYRAFAAGAGACPPRIDVHSEGAYRLGLAAGISGRYAALRLKSDVVSERLVDGVPRKEKFCVEPGLYLGLVLLFDANDGALLAILHDGLLQQMRVGADSALGVRYMARADASALGILGAGGMARSHVAAISGVRPLRHLRVYSPTRANRERFAHEMAAAHGLDAVAVTEPAQVYAGADIVCSCASAVGPVIEGARLEPGTHVTCIGGTLDAAANARVDRALRFGLAPPPREAPDLVVVDECLTFAGGAAPATGSTRRYADIPADRRLSFSDYLAGTAAGRTSAGQLTFSERGNIHGVQFAAVAGLLYERAVARGVGRDLPSSLFMQRIRN